MAAYVLVDIDVRDPERYKDYMRVSHESVEKYGGKFLVRGGAKERLEGDWQPHRLVILEFESLARAKAWWSSPEYAEPKKLRQATAVSNLVVVEGV
jgi:uncharacterized protein (DUF1330 family)